MAQSAWSITNSIQNDFIQFNWHFYLKYSHDFFFTLIPIVFQVVFPYFLKMLMPLSVMRIWRLKKKQDYHYMPTSLMESFNRSLIWYIIPYCVFVGVINKIDVRSDKCHSKKEKKKHFGTGIYFEICRPFFRFS